MKNKTEIAVNRAEGADVFGYLRVRRTCMAAILLFVLALAFASPASARELKIEKFSAEIFIQQDASLEVNETIDVNFIGVWHGLYRTIPVEYVTPQGFNYSLFVKLEDATDDAGQPLKVESSRQGHYLKWKIYVDDATDVDRTIHLRYKVRNGLKFFEDHDELYWNVTGDEWDVPVHDASAQILLPPGVTGVRTNVFTGSFGSTAHGGEASTSGSTVEVSMDRPLSFHEGLTVAVAFDKGFVKEPGTGDLIGQFFESNWPLFLPILVFFIMFWLWSTRGRDPRIGSVAVQYEPPDGLTPAEAGTLVDEQAAMRDITATIVDLAVRGYIVIEEKEKAGIAGMLLHTKDYTFHLKKGLAEWPGLKAHELALLGGIFSNGALTDVDLSSLQNVFYRNLPTIKNNIFDELMQHGYFQHRPDYVRGGFITGAIVAGVLLFFMGSAMSQKMGMAPAPFFVAAIFSAGIIAGFGWFMPARTATGAKALAGVLGFEDFLTHVESDHMSRVSQTPETFEKFLPFAMALGVEKKWVGAFQNIYSQPPSWYQGNYSSGGFYPIMFVNSLDHMTMSASSIMASAPRSSGGSGFGGGGSSGGGFGGGGGGGF
ncbi:MAG TPA: DUF2207 domain-containing protein [Candidatus Saccharimonadales bacterium]|jgi:uncharacterized membrane protein|nr:DUF2207 domain-containing protein [Candidatus Saccharimonadales bacterium]